MIKDITFRRCENPMCRRVIWSYQYKYGAGLYCDRLCYDESSKVIKRKFKMNRQPRYKTKFEHKKLSIILDINK